ncbi:hypothetical protein, partial [Ruminococcus sp.]|uniref:hypothetical protein n=1 Tax=Ruminococcus sp. TaxID=41978 RepID=UPI003FD71C8D
VSFRQILLHTAEKILAGRQPACVFFSCLQQNYARKSAYISCEDKFLLYISINENRGKVKGMWKIIRRQHLTFSGKVLYWKQCGKSREQRRMYQ